MKRSMIVTIISSLLILLWVYAASSKLIDFERSKGEMYNQALPHWMEVILVWAVPLVEIATAILLVFIRTRFKGTIISLMLLMLFTIYIGLVKLNYFDYVPCACGGVIRSLTWTEHLFFNLFFLFGASVSFALQLLRKEREEPK